MFDAIFSSAPKSDGKIDIKKLTIEYRNITEVDDLVVTP